MAEDVSFMRWLARVRRLESQDLSGERPEPRPRPMVHPSAEVGTWPTSPGDEYALDRPSGRRGGVGPMTMPGGSVEYEEGAGGPRGNHALRRARLRSGWGVAPPVGAGHE